MVRDNVLCRKPNGIGAARIVNDAMGIEPYRVGERRCQKSI